MIGDVAGKGELPVDVTDAEVDRVLRGIAGALVREGLPPTLAEEAVGLRKPPGSKRDAERYAKALAKR